MVMATTRTDDGGDDADRCLHSFRPSKGSSIYKVDSALLSCLHNVHAMILICQHIMTLSSYVEKTLKISISVFM